jgi:hypothetical protein
MIVQVSGQEVANGKAIGVATTWTTTTTTLRQSFKNGYQAPACGPFSGNDSEQSRDFFDVFILYVPVLCVSLCFFVFL